MTMTFPSNSSTSSSSDSYPLVPTPMMPEKWRPLVAQKCQGTTQQGVRINLGTAGTSLRISKEPGWHGKESHNSLFAIQAKRRASLSRCKTKRKIPYQKLNSSSSPIKLSNNSQQRCSLALASQASSGINDIELPMIN